MTAPRRGSRSALNRFRTAVAVVVLLLAGAGCARTDAVATERATTNVEAQIRAILDLSVVAWNRGDLEAHIAVYADSAVFRPSGEMRGLAEARRVFAPFFADPAQRPGLSIDSLSVTAMGDDHAVTTGQYVLTGGTTSVARRGWFTEVWARTPQGWRIILDHSS